MITYGRSFSLHVGYFSVGVDPVDRQFGVVKVRTFEYVDLLIQRLRFVHKIRPIRSRIKFSIK
jgi:hypothetical protein